ncbi:transposase [Escherichia coli]
MVPKEHSSGGKVRLLGITKRGDGYLRGLLFLLLSECFQLF